MTSPTPPTPPTRPRLPTPAELDGETFARYCVEALQELKEERERDLRRCQA
jgi:hypothetical protein